MKSLIGLVIFVAGATGTALAQADAFHGAWKVDLSKSKAYAGKLPQREIVNIEVKDGGEHTINDIISAEGVHTKAEYSAKYNDGQWHDYKSLDNGRVIGKVSMMRVDPRNELRVDRSPDGKMTGFILRSVSEDGKMITVTWYQPNGQIGQYLIADRQ